MNPDNKLWGHFDKILLACLFLIVTGVVFWVMHKFPDSESLHWVENADGQILAALLTLMVGQRMSQRKQDEHMDDDGKGATVTTTDKSS